MKKDAIGCTLVKVAVMITLFLVVIIITRRSGRPNVKDTVNNNTRKVVKKGSHNGSTILSGFAIILNVLFTILYLILKQCVGAFW